MIALTLYSRPACHLCDEMKAVILPLLSQFDATLEVIDIDTDPELVAAYGHDIPVLLVNGRKAFKHRLTPAELQRRLAREASA
ncbi:MAG TPA: glutaredoxin family protein [Terriglobales bacterium]|nr:glutaredoxin family protein [Terriglobales bacterium]